MVIHTRESNQICYNIILFQPSLTLKKIQPCISTYNTVRIYLLHFTFTSLRFPTSTWGVSWEMGRSAWCHGAACSITSVYHHGPSFGGVSSKVHTKKPRRINNKDRKGLPYDQSRNLRRRSMSPSFIFAWKSINVFLSTVLHFFHLS